MIADSFLDYKGSWNNPNPLHFDLAKKDSDNFPIKKLQSYLKALINYENGMDIFINKQKNFKEEAEKLIHEGRRDAEYPIYSIILFSHQVILSIINKTVGEFLDEVNQYKTFLTQCNIEISDLSVEKRKNDFQNVKTQFSPLKENIEHNISTLENINNVFQSARATSLFGMASPSPFSGSNISFMPN